MHESGMIRSLLRTAQASAQEHGSQLRAVTVRLGVLAGGTAAHLREHFAEEIARQQLGHIELDIIEDPDSLGGVELVSVNLARPADD